MTWSLMRKIWDREEAKAAAAGVMDVGVEARAVARVTVGVARVADVADGMAARGQAVLLDEVGVIDHGVNRSWRRSHQRVLVSARYRETDTRPSTRDQSPQLPEPIPDDSAFMRGGAAMPHGRYCKYHCVRVFESRLSRACVRVVSLEPGGELCVFVTLTLFLILHWRPLQ